MKYVREVKHLFDIDIHLIGIREDCYLKVLTVLEFDLVLQLNVRFLVDE